MLQFQANPLCSGSVICITHWFGSKCETWVLRKISIRTHHRRLLPQINNLLKPATQQPFMTKMKPVFDINSSSIEFHCQKLHQVISKFWGDSSQSLTPDTWSTLCQLGGTYSVLLANQRLTVVHLWGIRVPRVSLQPVTLSSALTSKLSWRHIEAALTICMETDVKMDKF